MCVLCAGKKVLRGMKQHDADVAKWDNKKKYNYILRMHVGIHTSNTHKQCTLIYTK